MSYSCKPCLRREHDSCDYEKCICKEQNHDIQKAKDYWLERHPDESGFVERVRHGADGAWDKVANALIKEFNFVTAIQTDTIYTFTGKIYEHEAAEALIKEETEKRIIECDRKDCLEVIAKVKRKTYKNLQDFDSNSHFINCENGILDLRTMELKPHTPTYLSKILIPNHYKKPRTEDIEVNLQDTLFWKYLKTSFTINEITNQENMKTVLEIMASTFLKKDTDERSIMFLGNGENGKSVCLDYLKCLLGKENFSSIPLQVLTNDKFSTANLDGKLANIFPDLEKNELYHTGTFKDLSSHESIYAQKKHGQPFDLVPMATQLFSCNRFPKSYDQSQGFFRRWIIVKWERNFENDPDRDDNLKHKLLQRNSDMDRVFSNLIHIAKKLLETNKFSYSKDWKVIQKEWNTNADPLDDFVDNYIIDSDRNPSKRETYQFYKKIMFYKNEVPLGMGKFGKAFAEYFDDSKSNGTRTWLNIDFKVPKQESLSEFDTGSKECDDID